MDGLPTELLLESLSLLTVPTIAIVGNINKLFSELTEEKWLIRQFPHCQIDNQLFFCDKLVNLDIKADITDQLIKISQDSYQSDEQLLWCLVQCTGWTAAWNAIRNVTRNAARHAAWYAARFADWHTARDPWDAARDTPWYIAWHAEWVAVREAARNPWDADWVATRDAAQNAAWTAINNCKINDLKLIGQLAYIAAERTILIKLPEIVKHCRAILIEKIPNYREFVVDLEIPADTTNPFFLQYRQLFVTK